MFKIAVLNPGSTSTKIALYEEERLVYSDTIPHRKEDLAPFQEIADQLPFRRREIRKAFAAHGTDLSEIDAFSAICTGLRPTPAGVYEVSDAMYADGLLSPGSKQPGSLGPVLARDFAEEYNARAFVVDPSSADEFIPEARLTGFHEILRTSRGHPLNQRAAARRCAADLGKPYEELNLIVVHMGGGISVTANRRGRMIDMVDSTRGEGRMAPTRSGAVPVADVIELCFSGRYTEKELLSKVLKTGGWTDLLGTADGREIERRIEAGDRFAELVYRTTAYQIGKDVGAMAAVLEGDVDAVVLTGGLAHSERLTSMITERVRFLAPVRLYPGEFEMEALAQGALRILRGEEIPLSYTGEPVFRGFEAELHPA